MEMKNLPGASTTRESSLHHRLILRDTRVARVARFSVAWTTDDLPDAVMRQATVPELIPDQE